jgi:hypothetical protein
MDLFDISICIAALVVVGCSLNFLVFMILIPIFHKEKEFKSCVLNKEGELLPVIRLKLTKRDMSREYTSSTKCPIATALRRELGPSWKHIEVGINYVYIEKDCSYSSGRYLILGGFSYDRYNRVKKTMGSSYLITLLEDRA